MTMENQVGTLQHTVVCSSCGYSLSASLEESE